MSKDEVKWNEAISVKSKLSYSQTSNIAQMSKDRIGMEFMNCYEVKIKLYLNFENSREVKI